jgi:hypothetical protein
VNEKAASRGGLFISPDQAGSPLFSSCVTAAGDRVMVTAGPPRGNRERLVACWEIVQFARSQ